MSLWHRTNVILHKTIGDTIRINTTGPYKVDESLHKLATSWNSDNNNNSSHIYKYLIKQYHPKTDDRVVDKNYEKI